MGHRRIHREVVGVVVALRSQPGGEHAHQLEHHHEPRQHHPHRGPLALFVEDDRAHAQIDHKGDEGEEDEGDAGQHHLHDGAAEVPHHLSGHALHVPQAKVDFEKALAAVLHAGEHRPPCHQHAAQNAGHFPVGNQVQHQKDGQPCRQGEQQNAK